ncbi:MAG: GTP cyclohydrolase I [Salinibacterium sp.]|nr:GTP cyclohydrolase I [Salinibacterium sp.]
MNREVDREAAERAVADLLRALGRDLTTESLVHTPGRVVTSLIELLGPTEVIATTFPNAEGYIGPVVVRDIPFHSTCEHHLMPFRGVAHVGYIPRDRIVGISTLPRIVEHFSRDLQVQERLTVNVADWLERELGAVGVGVVIEAEQLCMSLRGIGTPSTITVTSAFRGTMTRADLHR